jgi:hypothetical protein
MASSKPRSLVSELVFLTAFSGAAVLLASLLLALYSFAIGHPYPRRDRAKHDEAVGLGFAEGNPLARHPHPHPLPVGEGVQSCRDCGTGRGSPPP